MRVRKKPRHEIIIEKNKVVEQVAIKAITEKKKSTKPKVTTNKDVVADITSSDIQSLQLQHEKELDKLKEQLASAVKPTINEEKILSAIKSEKLIQETNTPIISRNLLMRQYNLRPKYLDKSIQGLIQKGVIKRTFVKYSSTQNTSQWEILQ